MLDYLRTAMIIFITMTRTVLRCTDENGNHGPLRLEDLPCSLLHRGILRLNGRCLHEKGLAAALVGLAGSSARPTQRP